MCPVFKCLMNILRVTLSKSPVFNAHSETHRTQEKTVSVCVVEEDS